MNTLPIAVKFVSWDIPTLETLENSKAYALRVKLNNGQSRKELVSREREEQRLFQNGNPLTGLSV